MKIIQHFPSYCDGFEPEQAEFNSTEELLNIEWVKSFSEHKDFYRYSVSDGNHLMAEYEQGYKWWVIGRLSPTTDLPKWEAKYKPPTPEEIEAKQKQTEEAQKLKEERDLKYKTEHISDYMSVLEGLISPSKCIREGLKSLE